MAIAVAASCDGDDGGPDTLMDGSNASKPPVELETVDERAVLTAVRVVPVDEIEAAPLSADCLRGLAEGSRPNRALVERVGIVSETVTLRDPTGLFGCDDTPGPRVEDRRWCGGSYGRLVTGNLFDPRLDIGGCLTADGDPVAFVWVEPGRRTHYVAVPQPDYVEVYERAGGLPIRIATTTGLIEDPLGVSFEISEHDSTGRLLMRRHIEAAPAG